MSILDVQDELLSGDARYRVRDNAGNITQDNVAIEQITEVTKEGTPINKVLFDDLQSVAIGYNKLDNYEDSLAKNEVDYTTSKGNAIVHIASTVYSATKIKGTNDLLVAYKPSSTGYLGILLSDGNNGASKGSRIEEGETVETSISTCSLGNGNILVCYNQYKNVSTSHGKFVIVNSDRQTVKSATNFYAEDKMQIKVVHAYPLGNGGAIIFYGIFDNDLAIQYSSTNYTTIDMNGNILTTGSLNQAGYPSLLKATPLKDGRLFVTTNGRMYILDKDGATEKYQSIGKTGEYFCPKQLNNGNVMIAYGYSSSGSPYAPYFVIYDLDFNLVLDETLFYDARFKYQLDIITFTNGNVCIVFFDNTATQYKFIIYDENGKLVQSALTIGYAYTSIKNAIAMEDDSIFFVGGDGTNLISYIVGLATSYYSRNYILPKVGNPLEGQRLKVWNYRETFGQNYSDSAVYQNQLLQFDNGNILVAFRDYVSGTLGAYIVYNEKGKIIKDFTIFNSEVTTIHDLIKLKNGNAMILFTETTIVGSYFMIFDQNMNVVKEKTAIGNDNSGYLSGQTIDNNNVIIVRRPTTTLNLVYSIYSEDGNLVKAETEITSDSPNYVSISETGTANNMGMIFYTVNVSSSSSPCKYHRYTSSGEIIDGVGRMSTGAGVVKEVRTCKLKNGYTFVAYWSNTSTSSTSGIGYFQIWNPAGYLDVSETRFSSGGNVRYISLAVLESGNVCIFFGTTVDGRYIIYSETGRLIKEETVIDDTEIPVYLDTAQLSNGNTLFAYTYNNIGQIRSLAIDDPPLISSTLNDVSVDTIFTNESFYELVYNGEGYIAKEVRI